MMALSLSRPSAVTPFAQRVSGTYTVQLWLSLPENQSLTNKMSWRKMSFSFQKIFSCRKEIAFGGNEARKELEGRIGIWE